MKIPKRIVTVIRFEAYLAGINYHNSGITTLDKAIKATDTELLKLPGMGETTLAQFREWIKYNKLI